MSPFQKIIKYFAMGFAAFLMVGILTSIVAVVSGLGSGIDTYEINKNYVSFTKDFDNVKNLNFSNGDKKLTLVSGDTDKVIVEAKNVPDSLEVKVTSDGTLTIKDRDRFHISWIIGWSGNWNSDMEIIVTVPRDFTVGKVELDSGSANMEVNDLTADNMIIDGGSGSFIGRNLSAKKANISLGSGSTRLDYVKFEKGKMDCGSGDVKIENAIFRDVDFDGGSGSISYSGQLSGKTSLNCGSGRISFELEGKREDYNINSDSGSGGIWIDGTRADNYKERNSDVNNEIKIDGGSGRVLINFYSE
ncbi:DUF4097 family beta strand repeat-containing protein [Lachnoclostridium phytofermentans]|uniref:DUF4097 domain-containing protein n=1 Tax=Lachnoclostridium phytofermentans (strain ATCC 700394 / DSM 18823 / ISDg) TaxID=357809 RepID=A9KHH3_LACP7|nr:DUF4097 family beta strand repeat-containing protein [Lachnoclostridium phytofermentans]ABX40840.1 hypothetical protein Cphy_0453 [Lachnoclostridium phytofermentans ISDg]